MGRGVCILIPAYNEAKAIGEVIDDLPASVKVGKKEYPITVLVVNDGSSDGTHEVVLARRHVILINHVMNGGAGAATRTGLNYARDNGFDYVVSMDADGQHLKSDVIKVIKEIIKGKADFIIGSRLVDATGMPWYRVLGNRGLNVIAFVLFGVWVSDVQSGLRAYNKTALKKISFHSSDFGFCPEMIWVAHMQKLRIAEVPIKAVYTDYSLSKGQLGRSNIDAGVKVVQQLIKQRLMRLINE